MVVGAATDDRETSLDQFVGKHGSVFLYLHGPLFELRLQGFVEGNSLGGDDMLQRSALLAGEHGTVEQLTHHLGYALGSLQTPWVFKVFAHQDDTATRTAECLVGGRGHDVCILDRVVKQAGCNKACWVCHIHHEQCAHLVGNLTHALVVPFTAVGRTTTNDELGLVLHGKLLHLVIVYTTGLFVEVIAHCMIKNT